jgi:hypothetical protein
MSVTDTIKEYGNKAYDKAGELAAKAENATDGFFSKNKGFLVGLVVALTAMFSMDSGSSGTVPMLFGLAALAVGIFSDKNGIFHGLFGGAPAHAVEPEKDKGLEKKLDAPAIATGPSLDKKVEVKATEITKFMVSKDGKIVPSDREPGVDVMYIETNSAGKIIDLAATNSDGKFALNADKSIRGNPEVVAKMDMNFELKKDADNKPYIDLGDPKNLETLKTARNTIGNIKTMDNITDDLKNDLTKPMSYEFTDHPKHNLPPATMGKAAKKQTSVEI